MRAFASAAQGGRVARVEGSNVHLFGGTQWHCFVVADPAQRVCGYYALTAGAVAHQLGSSAIRRNMPDPVQVLACLAVARHEQGKNWAPPCYKTLSTARWWWLKTPACVRCWCMRCMNGQGSFMSTTGFRLRLWMRWC